MCGAILQYPLPPIVHALALSLSITLGFRWSCCCIVSIRIRTRRHRDQDGTGRRKPRTWIAWSMPCSIVGRRVPWHCSCSTCTLWESSSAFAFGPALALFSHFLIHSSWTSSPIRLLRRPVKCKTTLALRLPPWRYGLGCARSIPRLVSIFTVAGKCALRCAKASIRSVPYCIDLERVRPTRRLSKHRTTLSR